MDISERIQGLRKAGGLSQEELADRLGVSRQAVSKWESGQSTPDLEKVIGLSSFFSVSTDYILKGTEPEPPGIQPGKKEGDAYVFAIAGTALNLVGLIISAMIWYEKQTAAATAAGLIFMVLGCMVFAIGMAQGEADSRVRAKELFFRINIWVLDFIPLAMVYNILTGNIGTAPYPLISGGIPGLAGFGLFWAVYIVTGCCVSRRRRKRAGSK